MLKNTAAIHVGRLLEIRVDLGYRTAADVDRLFDQIDAAIARLPHPQRMVTVADWRRCPIMESQAAERLAQRMAGANARTERSAALASEQAPIAVLQFVRLIRESGLPDRKMFVKTSELLAWIDEVLEPDERARLRLFLEEA